MTQHIHDRVMNALKLAGFKTAHVDFDNFQKIFENSTPTYKYAINILKADFIGKHDGKPSIGTITDKIQIANIYLQQLIKHETALATISINVFNPYTHNSVSVYELQHLDDANLRLLITYNRDNK